ncbi:MAG: Ni/Fe-hydrogenase cytochrome b subunit [Candidatus Marinimicrobia bacterium]|nr:Ni/Fe-hydrogenase cytochrome b subunit [Candidatus Neomarinimicrobiota bacterium]
MHRFISPRITFWRSVSAIILILGAYALLVRYTQGLGAATNLSDDFPWGLWIGFDVLCGVGLAAGGFTISSLVYIFNIKKFKPILRPALLTALLGYILVILALLVDLGRPLRIWHAVIMWNPHSVMFEVAWCVLLYTGVLALEFSPLLLERLHMRRILKVFRMSMPLLVILGVILSTLHQSSLGSLYLIVPERMSPLWYTPMLPVLYFVSAVMVGFAMVIFESFMSSKAFNRHLEMSLLNELGRILVFLITIYGILRLQDLLNRDALIGFNQWSLGNALFMVEIIIGLLFPLVLLAIPKIRMIPAALFSGAVMVIMGFVLNRLNTVVTSFEMALGRVYVPSWMEIAVTIAIVNIGVIGFVLAARYLAVFPEGPLGLNERKGHAVPTI